MVRMRHILVNRFVCVHTTRTNNNSNTLLCHYSSTVQFIVRFSGHVLHLEEYTTRRQSALCETIERHSDSFDSQSVSNVLWALGKLEFNLNKESPLVQTTMYSMAEVLLINDLNDHSGDTTTIKWQSSHLLAQTLSGFVNMGVLWKELPSSLQQVMECNILRNSQNMDSQGRAITLHSLGKLRWNINTVSDNQLKQCVYEMAVILLTDSLAERNGKHVS
jgi:hypothetical protein